MIFDCLNDYSAYYNENNFFGFEWQTYNSSYSPDPSLINIYTAFQYTDASQINSYLYTGPMNTYPGGGYVYKMNMTDSPSFIMNQTRLLESLKWIDKRTAAIFVEFTLFNPNVNLFQYCSILFEILPSGSFVNSARFNSLDLANLNNTKLLSLKILIYIIYMAFIGVFMIMELRKLFKLGRKYFVQLNNFFELAIIAFSWSAFAMYLYRLYSSQTIYKQISAHTTQSLNSVFINLQYTVNCDQLFNYFIGFCAALTFVRFIYLLRFSRRIIVFLVALQKSLAELASFGLIFAILWLSFVQVFYLILKDQSKQYSTFYNAMATCFQIIMGKFNADIFYQSNTFLATGVFIAFNVCIVFALLSTMISILIDYYHLARDDSELDRNDPNLFNYVSLLVRGFVFRSRPAKISQPIYKEFWDSLPDVFDSYVSRINSIIAKVKK